ncbi:MAG: hypothetical protein ACR2P0_18950 [Acidimicrobiales bacterium]
MRAPESPPAPADGRFERLITALVVFSACLFVFWQVQLELIFRDTTPTGGDMGAHVWGPAFLRDELLPRFRFSGWTPDWYSGFPAFHFYMVVPSLLIVILDVGLDPLLSIPLVVIGGYATVRIFIAGDRVLATRFLIVLAVAAPFIVSIPYNVAFKLVAVSGVVLFPLGAWALGHLSGLRFPGPAVLSLASLAFAFDRSFNIYGGNIASTMAGEFAASISFTLSLVALGYVIRGTRTGGDKAKAAVFIALTGLNHLLPAFFLLAAMFVVVLVRLVQSRWASVAWLTIVGTLSALASAFWVLPFYARTDYLNDMGWERIEIIHSPLVTRSKLNPSDVLSDYPPLPVLLLLGLVGVLLSIRHRLDLGFVLTGTAALMALGFVIFPDGRLWNARILPFYYLSVTLLAGIGVALLVREVVRMPWQARLSLGAIAVALLLVPEVRDGWVWPEPGTEEPYLRPALMYTARVMSTAWLVVLLLTEAPRQLSRLVEARLLVAVMTAVAVLIVSPTRDVRIESLDEPVGIFWAFVLFLSILTLVGVLGRAGLALVRRAEAIRVHRAMPPPVEPVIDPGFYAPVMPAEPPPVPVILPTDRRSVLWAAPVAAAATVFVLLGLALDTIGGTERTDAGRSWALGPLEITSDDNSFVPGWARWNFSGLQAKPQVDGSPGDVGQGGWLEYQYVQRTMLGVGQEVGCGRALWEFAPELNRYGTTMAMMLLPMWTDGCIGSMEGLYFEATPTVPYHFLAQSELSAPSRTVGVSESVGGPSRAMRDLPYESFDIERGVEFLHELGVRYYLAFSPQTIAAAREHPELVEVTTASPWVVFETEATLVAPLENNPVVVDGVRNHQDQWLDLGVEWFTGEGAVRPASSGPDEWDRVDADAVVARYEDSTAEVAGSIAPGSESLLELLPTTPVTTLPVVSDVSTDTDRISFSVDRVGEPVIVRSSYFPNWTAQGAEGPFRVAPNFMVVVPTETDVELVFERTSIDWIAIGLTLVGIVGLIVVASRRVAERDVRRESA